jgi:uncharacterized membrane protein (UPF0182 family)
MRVANRRLFAARPRLLVPVIVVLILLVVLVAVFTRLYTDLLFFRSIGFSKVFDTVLYTRVLLFVLFGVLMATAIGANIVLAYKLRPPIRPLSLEQQNLERYRVAIEPYLLLILLVVSGAFGLISGLSASGRWRTWLAWQNGTSFGQKDPQFGRDVSYFAFTYPFQRFVLGFLFTVVLLSLVVTALTHYLFGGIRLQTQGERVVPAAKAHLSVLLGIFALLKAAAYYLDRFGLVFSPRGVVTGASYTDVHAVLPAKLILLFISLLCAVLFIYNIFQRGWTLPALSFGILVLSALVIGGLYPTIVQQFRVRPNEAAREAPYIDRNIKATRAAYGIDQIKAVPYASTTDATAAQVQDDTGTIPNVRLLDPNKLPRTFDQLQQIRGYYGFPASLDIDRYTLGGKTQDYIVAVREVDQSGLSSDQRNWINLHLTYTHGNGFVAAPANSVDDQGRPKFVEKDLPVTGPLQLTQPRIYFGEQSPDYSIVSTNQQEIDGPGAGTASQASNSYDGKGGVSVGSTFRRALFALRFREKNILLSSALKGDSRILYIRNPRDRVQKAAPWLTLDGDPYPAVINGHVQWILDGYTTSAGYPYSERRNLSSITSDSVTVSTANRSQQSQSHINYIRNSVKATVDAYDGTVTLYEWDDKDPVLRTWEKAFPGTVKPKSQISGDLMQHLRYPEDLFKVQREMLSSYHVQNARDFYSKEDFWAVSAAPDNNDQRQPPFYLYSQLPGRAAPAFNLTSPLISRRSSKLASYLAVSSDPNNYGQFTLLQLPQGTTINGPVQVQAAIESDRNVSSALTPLRLGGSRTIEGNLLTLPVAGGLLYVEPYYVQAAGASGYPTLQKIAVVYGDRIGFADTFPDALAQVFTTNGGGTPAPGGGGTGGGGAVTSPQAQQAIKDAQDAFSAGQKALQKSPPDFAAYGEEQQKLTAALERLARLSSATPSPSRSPSPRASGSGSAARTTPARPSAGRSPKASATASPRASPSP